MKTLFLFLTLIFYACHNVFAQTVCPMVQEGKVWVYETGNDFTPPSRVIFSLEGDTLVGFHQCQKLYITDEDIDGNNYRQYKGAMYEKEGNVYFIAPGTTMFVLMYDFSSEQGTIIKLGAYEIKIKKKELVKYRNEYLRVVYYSPLEDGSETHSWIEGVGITTAGNLTTFIDGYATWLTGGYWSMISCSINGQVVFDDQDFYVSGEIVTDIPTPTSSLSTRERNIYDLQGHQITNPRKGIYIKDGKKVIAK
ncbi:MAG: hypothetical protein IJ020_03530 [Bacteroidaceae bacterium]|jgi:hypothetical protein|nr:hypothetical protein [Bacteroidaceae bacterium]